MELNQPIKSTTVAALRPLEESLLRQVSCPEQTLALLVAYSFHLNPCIESRVAISWPAPNIHRKTPRVMATERTDTAACTYSSSLGRCSSMKGVSLGSLAISVRKTP